VPKAKEPTSTTKEKTKKGANAAKNEEKKEEAPVENVKHLTEEEVMQAIDPVRSFEEN